VIQAVQKAYSLILILQLAAYKQDDPDRKKVEHNFKLLLTVMVIPKELAIFALYAHLPPDSFRPLCQWFSEQDRLSLIDQACRSPCSLEQMIILFWKGDSERIVYSIAQLTPDSPLVEDPQIVTHLKMGIRSHAHLGVLEFLLHRMHHQHEIVVGQLKASPSKIQEALTHYLTQLKEIFELGLQHGLASQILQSLQKKIVRVHDQVHLRHANAQEYFSQLLSKTLAEQGPMNGILALLEIIHPGSNELSQALIVVLKSLELEKSSWNWEDVSKFVHRLIFQYHYQPTYLQLESFMKQLSSLKTPEFNANTGFILETLNSLLHSVQPKEREQLQREFSKNRSLPEEIINKLSSC